MITQGHCRHSRPPPCRIFVALGVEASASRRAQISQFGYACGARPPALCLPTAREPRWDRRWILRCLQELAGGGDLGDVLRARPRVAVSGVLASPGQSAGPTATLSAAGYENTAQGWKLIAAKTIGKPNQWFWYSVSVCGLTVTQLKPEPSSAAPSDTVTVTLLMTPAFGCSGAITEDFGPGA